MTNDSVGEEARLLRAVADEDKSAFESLFRLYHPRIYKFTMRMLHDHQQTEEVVCDTLYAVWKSAGKFRGQSKPSTWILGIAYRLALKKFNKQIRYTDRLQSDVVLDDIEESAPGSNPESYANSVMEGHQLMSALTTLSVDHRAVMELTALGHSISDIADIVGCPENTVKTRTFHARRKLRSAMQEVTV